MRVGVDIDGVLADLVEATIKAWNEENPDRQFKVGDWTSWDVWKIMGNTPKEMHRLMDLGWSRWPDMLPMEPGLRQSLRRLRRVGHTIHIITGRNPGSYLDVVRWLDLHRIPYDSLTFLIKGVDKLEFPVDVLIDDNPNEVLRVPFGKQLYLRDQPWNRMTYNLDTAMGGNIKRVSGVREMVDDILRRELHV